MAQERPPALQTAPSKAGPHALQTAPLKAGLEEVPPAAQSQEAGRLRGAVPLQEQMRSAAGTSPKGAPLSLPPALVPPRSRHRIASLRLAGEVGRPPALRVLGACGARPDRRLGGRGMKHQRQ